VCVCVRVLVCVCLVCVCLCVGVVDGLHCVYQAAKFGGAGFARHPRPGGDDLSGAEDSYVRCPEFVPACFDACVYLCVYACMACVGSVSTSDSEPTPTCSTMRRPCIHASRKGACRSRGCANGVGTCVFTLSLSLSIFLSSHCVFLCGQRHGYLLTQSP